MQINYSPASVEKVFFKPALAEINNNGRTIAKQGAAIPADTNLNSPNLTENLFFDEPSLTNRHRYEWWIIGGIAVAAAILFCYYLNQKEQKSRRMKQYPDVNPLPENNSWEQNEKEKKDYASPLEQYEELARQNASYLS